VRVAQLWRYPVKSLAGERLPAVSVDGRGLVRDRLWALVDPDGRIASGKTTRRFRNVPGLLRHRSHLAADDRPEVTLAGGRSAQAGSPQLDALLAETAPAGWSLQGEGSTPHFDAGAVHVVTTATLATLGSGDGEPLAVERLRPNLVLDTNGGAAFPEDAWLGRTLRVGAVELRIVMRTERCVMVGHAQATLPSRPTLLKRIGRVNGACAGVYADVILPGTIAEGDAAQLL